MSTRKGEAAETAQESGAQAPASQPDVSPPDAPATEAAKQVAPAEPGEHAPPAPEPESIASELGLPSIASELELKSIAMEPLAPPDAAAAPAGDIPPSAAARMQELSKQASVPPPARAAVAPGLVLDGRYRVDNRLGIGGVGAVYTGTQLALGRKVAIKLLHEGLDPSFRARFEREARALASLRHPNVVSVTDFGVDGQTPYLVMELLEGETLHERLRRGRLLPEHALEVCRQLLRALVFVHEQGLVHRDLKPGNLFLELTIEGEERLKLLDFGLAKFVDGPQNEGTTLTRAGHVVGTPAYMAPEQIAGDAVDARADLYATGVMLFQMLTGRVPFPGEPMEQLRSHLVAEVPSLRASLPPELAPRPELMALIERSMRKKRDERYADAAEMLAALEAVPQPWLIAPGLMPEAIVPVAADREPKPRAKPAQTATDRRSLLWTAAAALALTLLVLVLSRGGDEPATVHGVVKVPSGAKKKSAASAAPSDAPPPAPVVAASAAGAVAGAPAPIAGAVAELPPGKPAARNPWTKDTPTELRVIRKKVTAGERGDERMITTLRKYNQETEADARGHLLLARMYLNRGWREDALKQLEVVCQVDLSARGAPLMLGDLLVLVTDPKTSRGAIRLVRSAYGREALPALDAQLMMPQADPDATVRLRALRTALLTEGG